MASRFSVSTEFTATDRFARPVARMQGRFNRFKQSAGRGFAQMNRAADGFVSGLKKVGLAATAAAIPIGLLAKNIIGVGSDFEQSMANVGAVMLKPKNELTELTAKAKELGATTKFTATQAADGMEIMARAGFSTKDIIQGLGGVLSAAAASGLELAEVSDHVSNVLKGMGLETSEASRVADVLALASSRTNSTIGTLGESMRNVASTARQLKIPLEDVVAGTAALQDVGLDASVAGSAMNTMLTKLAAPTDSLARKLKKMGVRFKDAEGNALPFADIVGNISKASKAAGGNMDQVALLAELVGLRGQKAAANLAQLFETGKLQELTAELKNAKGSAEAMAGLRMDTLKGDVLLLESAVDAVKVSLFETRGAPLRGVIQGMTEWVSKNGELIVQDVSGFIQKISDNMPEIVKWADRIGKMVAVFTAFAVGIKVATAAMAIFNAVMAANPIALIAIAIVAAIALIVAFWPEITEFFSNIWDGVKDIASRVTDAVSGIIDSVKGPVMAAFRGIGEFVMGWIKLMFLPLWPLIALTKVVFAGAKDFIIANWTPISNFFSSLWGGIKTAFQIQWDIIMAIVDLHVDMFKAAWEPLKSFFSALWEDVAATFSFFFDPIISQIKFVIDKVQEIGRSDFFSFGDGDDDGSDQSIDTSAQTSRRNQPTVQPQVIMPSERVSRSITESNSTTSAEVTIRDESGRAQITKPPKGNGIGLRLQPSGAP